MYVQGSKVRMNEHFWHSNTVSEIIINIIINMLID